MKKALVLTYYWPPSGGAGVQRWLKFVKYMRQYGWEPVVYTAANPETPVNDDSLVNEIPRGITVLKTPIWEPYDIYKKFIGRKKEDKINASFLNENRKTGLTEKISIWIRGNFFIPDARRFWIKPSITYLAAYMKENDISCVISSGPPHSMHLIALGLKKQMPSLKWLADFRDPWTNIDFYEKLMLTPMADRKHHLQELSVLKNADLVVSIGQGMSDEFAGMYQKSGGSDLNKFRVITNGYDPADTAHKILEKDVKFSLAHIGTLVKDRNPDVLWKVLSRLIKTHKALEAALEIKLVGKVDLYVTEQIAKYGLSGYVNKINYLPHNEVIKEQQKSKVLLLLVNNTKNAKGILTGKVFEYMASGVPVLAIGPEDGELAHIMEQTGCGLISGFENEQLLEKNILDLFNGQVVQRNENEVSKYSREALTRQLCTLLDELV
jgi:glycosyltransferase involved in cell wall biosynthesis